MIIPETLTPSTDRTTTKFKAVTISTQCQYYDSIEIKWFHDNNNTKYRPYYYKTNK